MCLRVSGPHVVSNHEYCPMARIIGVLPPCSHIHIEKPFPKSCLPVHKLYPNCSSSSELIYVAFFFLIVLHKLCKDTNMASNGKWGIVHEIMLVNEL